MSGQDLADYIGARLVREGFWRLKRPVHFDEGESLMVIDQGFRPAILQCSARCSRVALAKQFGLSLKDYISKPKGEPSFSAMTEGEIEDYWADRNSRQIAHAEVCVLIRERLRVLKQVRKEIGYAAMTTMSVSQRARWRLAQRELKEFNVREKQLRS